MIIKNKNDILKTLIAIFEEPCLTEEKKESVRKEAKRIEDKILPELYAFLMAFVSGKNADELLGFYIPLWSAVQGGMLWAYDEMTEEGCSALITKIMTINPEFSERKRINNEWCEQINKALEPLVRLTDNARKEYKYGSHTVDFFQLDEKIFEEAEKVKNLIPAQLYDFLWSCTSGDPPEEVFRRLMPLWNAIGNHEFRHSDEIENIFCNILDFRPRLSALMAEESLKNSEETPRFRIL